MDAKRAGEALRIYTAIFGGYDTLQPLPEGVTGVCFTDAQIAARGWELRQSQFADADPRLRARHHKCMSHVLFPGETTLWIDGNIQVWSLPPEREFATFHHKMGIKGIGAEIEECARCVKFTGDENNVAAHRMAAWKSEGFPDSQGHPETCVLMRGPGTAAFNELWWELVQQVRRDQTSCDYAVWKTGLKWEPWSGTVLDNEHVRQVNHEPHPTPPAERIFYFTPYDPRGLGVAYNNCCRIVPDDAWVCVMDADVMLFPSYFGDAVQAAIAKDPGVDVWTTCATRINCNREIVCPGGREDEERDLAQLYRKSTDWAKAHEGQVERMRTQWLGGYFMLFRKSLWNQYPFPEMIQKTSRGARRGCTVLGIDTTWSNELHKAGKVFGLIKGLLAVHYYSLDGNRANHFYELERNGATRGALTSGRTRLKWDKTARRFRRIGAHA